MGAPGVRAGVIDVYRRGIGGVAVQDVNGVVKLGGVTRRVGAIKRPEGGDESSVHRSGNKRILSLTVGRRW